MGMSNFRIVITGLDHGFHWANPNVYSPGQRVRMGHQIRSFILVYNGVGD